MGIKRGIKNKGQLQISFGMIFSIILIIVFIAFAFFGIKKFMQVQNDVLSKKFMDDVNNDIEKLWKSSRGSQEVSYSVPREAESVCFGERDEEYEDYYNVYFLPEEKIYNGKIEHVDFDSTLGNEDALCIEVENRKVTFVIDKDYGETLVTISQEGRDFTRQETEDDNENSNSGSEDYEYVDYPDFGIFDIKFSHDFESDTLGIYKLEELKRDFQTDYTPDAYSSNLLFIENKKGSKTAKSVYPEGQWGTQGDGGTGTIFESYPNEMIGETELYLSYNVLFEEGFDWGLGGKLLGMMGRPIPHSGTHITDQQAFRVHTFWDSGGDMRFYLYDHDNTMIYGRGNGGFGIKFPEEQWASVTLRVSLNDVGQKNGFIEAYYNGKLVKQMSGLNLRNYNYDIDILYIETFMGGDSEDFAPDHTQYMWIDDIYVYKYKAGTTGVPDEREMGSLGLRIPLPNWPKQ